MKTKEHYMGLDVHKDTATVWPTRGGAARCGLHGRDAAAFVRWVCWSGVVLSALWHQNVRVWLTFGSIA